LSEGEAPNKACVLVRPLDFKPPNNNNNNTGGSSTYGKGRQDTFSGGYGLSILNTDL